MRSRVAAECRGSASFPTLGVLPCAPPWASPPPSPVPQVILAHAGGSLWGPPPIIRTWVCPLPRGQEVAPSTRGGAQSSARHTLGQERVPAYPTSLPCPPACMETGVGVFTEGIYCSGTSCSQLFDRGYTGWGLSVSVTSACVPSTKEVLLSVSSASGEAPPACTAWLLLL